MSTIKVSVGQDCITLDRAKSILQLKQVWKYLSAKISSHKKAYKFRKLDNGTEVIFCYSKNELDHNTENIVQDFFVIFHLREIESWTKRLLSSDACNRN